jgi:hypothetical protein
MGERLVPHGDLMIRKVKESDLFLLEDSKSLRILITNLIMLLKVLEKLVVESLSKTVASSKFRLRMALLINQKLS